jgi:hypothetical protein
VIPIVAGILGYLEILSAVRLAGLGCVPSVLLALRHGRRIQQGRECTGARASPKTGAARPHRQVGVCPCLLPALKSNQLRLVDAGIALRRSFRIRLPAYVDRVGLRLIAGGKRACQSSCLFAIFATRSAGFDARVVAIDARVYRGLPSLLTTGVALSGCRCRVPYAGVASRRRQRAKQEQTPDP